MTPISIEQAFQNMHLATKNGPVRNYTQLLDMENYLLTTDLFSEECLNAYSAWNLEDQIPPEWEKYFSDERGGHQGDYREGMQGKIQNTIDCLTRYPKSKRAVITICNNPAPSHTEDADAKCLREVHFYIVKNKLNATALFRAQAVSIFPKNIHFIGSLMSAIAKGLSRDIYPGSLFYLATTLAADRES